MSIQITNRNDWIFGAIRNVLENKDVLVRHNVINMLNKTINMFEYKNLPDTIPAKDLEIQLQVAGYAIIKEVNGKLYSFTGGLGGKPNPYYLPTIATVANPALNYNENLVIDENCVVIINDYFYQGLMPMFSKYANLISEGEISLKYALINSRIPALIEADNDATYESAKQFIEKITKGTSYEVIGSKAFFDGLRSHEFTKVEHIKSIIESIQYIKGSWYNEVGINSTFNMKREAINEAEASLNDDALYPTVDTMHECRIKGFDKVNTMFGQDISVELKSVWKKNREQDNMQLKILSKEGE